MSKKILITGASGFIGSTLVHEALAKGWDVTAAIRPTSDKTFLNDSRIRFLELNFKSESALREKLLNAGRFDYVIHNAGTTKAIDKSAYMDTNSGNTERFVNILRGEGLTPKKFLFVSSLAALGPRKGNELIVPYQTPKPVTGYGDSKLAAEQFLSQQLDFPWVAIQPTAVFGPRDKEFFTFVQLINKGLEFYIGSKEQNLSFIYSKDLIAQMFAALEKGKVGKKYISTDGHNYTSSDLGNAVREAIGCKTIKIKIPLSIIGIVAQVSEQIGKWRQTATMLNTEKMNELAAESWLCDVSETISDLGVPPQYNLFSGMKETVKWYRDNNWM